MKAGELRHRVRVEKATESRDSTYGNVTIAWTTFAVVWASVEPLTGKETLTNDQVGADITHRVRMRYLAGITPKMRIVFRERALNIVSIANLLERNIEMEIMCGEAVT